MILRGVQFQLTGLPAWQSGQPGQVGNQAALTVESVPGSGSSPPNEGALVAFSDAHTL